MAGLFIKNKDGVIKVWTRTMKGGDVITYRARESSDGSTVIDSKRCTAWY